MDERTKSISIKEDEEHQTVYDNNLDLGSSTEGTQSQRNTGEYTTADDPPNNNTSTMEGVEVPADNDSGEGSMQQDNVAEQGKTAANTTDGNESKEEDYDTCEDAQEVQGYHDTIQQERNTYKQKLDDLRNLMKQERGRITNELGTAECKTSVTTEDAYDDFDIVTNMQELFQLLQNCYEKKHRRDEDEWTRQSDESMKQLQTAEANVQLYTGEYAKVKEALRKSEKELEDQIKVNKDLNEKQMKLQEEIGSEKHKNKFLTEDFQKSAGENKKLTNQIKNHLKENEQLKKTNKEFKEKKENMSKELKERKTDIEEYLKKSEKQLKENDRLKTLNSSLIADIKNYKAQIKNNGDHIQQQNSQLSMQYHSLQQKTRTIQEQNVQIHGYKRMIQEQNHQIQDRDRQIEEFMKNVQDLERERSSLTLRLSKLAGAQLTRDNPNIADLSDINRPTKLAEKYSELYDNEWTDAFEELSEKWKTDEDVTVKEMLDILKEVYEECKQLSEPHREILRNLRTVAVKINQKMTNKETDVQTELSMLVVQHQCTQTDEQNVDISVRDSIDNHQTAKDSHEPMEIGEMSDAKVPPQTVQQQSEFYESMDEGSSFQVEGQEPRVEHPDQGELERNLDDGSGYQEHVNAELNSRDKKVPRDAENKHDECANGGSQTEGGQNAISLQVPKDSEGERNDHVNNENQAEGQNSIQSLQESERNETKVPSTSDANVGNKEVQVPESEEHSNSVSRSEGQQNAQSLQESERDETKVPSTSDAIIDTKEKSPKVDVELPPGFATNVDTGEPTAELEVEVEFTAEQMKTVSDMKKICASKLEKEKEISKVIARKIAIQRKVDIKDHEKLMAFIAKCAQLCWYMLIQEPPVVIGFVEPTEDIKFDKDTYKAYTKVGNYLDFVVWPPLYLHENGPMLCKGTAQGKKKI